MTNTYLFLMILVISLVTALVRFLPFLIFGNKDVPNFINYLGKVLPYAVMGMLVVYCLKHINFLSVDNWIPELIATIMVIALQVWKRNMIVSIIFGTAIYMILVQVIF